MVFDSVNRFLDQHWKGVVWFGLLSGLAHSIIQFITISKAFHNSKFPGTGWEVKVLYNTVGEAAFEFYILIPASIAIILLALYVFFRKWYASVK